jgi:hypothetical protein
VNTVWFSGFLNLNNSSTCCTITTIRAISTIGYLECCCCSVWEIDCVCINKSGWNRTSYWCNTTARSTLNRTIVLKSIDSSATSLAVINPKVSIDKVSITNFVSFFW